MPRMHTHEEIMANVDKICDYVRGCKQGLPGMGKMSDRYIRSGLGSSAPLIPELVNWAKHHHQG